MPTLSKLIIRDSENHVLCPVCGFAGVFGLNSFDAHGGVIGTGICYCCLYEPGFDDNQQASASAKATFYESIQAYRAAWVEEKMPWRGQAQNLAKDWNAQLQLAALFKAAPWLKPMPLVMGFDKHAEPELRMDENGALEILFNHMPPLNTKGHEREPELFDHLEKDMAWYLGLEVQRDDREKFIIPLPSANTADAVAMYLSLFWTTSAHRLHETAAAKPKNPEDLLVNIGEFRLAMTERITPFLSQAGFKDYRNPPLVFKKKFSGGEYSVKIYADDFAPKFYPGVIIFVRIDLVERIFALCADTPVKEIKKWHTFFRTVRQAEINSAVFKPIEMDAWMTNFKPYFENLLLPELLLWSDLRHVAHAYNDRSNGVRAYEKYGGLYEHIASKGLIAAKLLNDPAFDQILAFHVEQMATHDHYGVFAKVADKVSKLSREELIIMVKER
jgi:hypothetical protein